MAARKQKSVKIMPQGFVGSDEPMPSQSSRSPWIYITSSKNNPSYGDPLLVGKWMIFVGSNIVDDLWTKIKTELIGGTLSSVAIAAKVSTPNPGKPRSHVLIIYTSDHHDKETIGCCLAALRTIGVSGRLYYKTDQQTRSGTYVGGKERPWTYSSDMFEGAPAS